MEMMPYQPSLDTSNAHLGLPPCAAFDTTSDERADWRVSLPFLEGERLTLREVDIEDAPSLFAQLTTEDVSRFISPPPADVAGFEKYIRWAHRKRAEGHFACFAIVPEGETKAVGMFQVRILDADQHIAEWGFAMGSGYWGSGLFLAGAKLVLEFAFTEMSVRRLEARSAIPNGRGNGALRKVGAVREAVLPKSFERQGEVLDQALWVITRRDWLQPRMATTGIDAKSSGSSRSHRGDQGSCRH